MIWDMLNDFHGIGTIDWDMLDDFHGVGSVDWHMNWNLLDDFHGVRTAYTWKDKSRSGLKSFKL